MRSERILLLLGSHILKLANTELAVSDGSELG